MTAAEALLDARNRKDGVRFELVREVDSVNNSPHYVIYGKFFDPRLPRLNIFEDANEQLARDILERPNILIPLWDARAREFKERCQVEALAAVAAVKVPLLTDERKHGVLWKFVIAGTPLALAASIDISNKGRLHAASALATVWWVIPIVGAIIYEMYKSYLKVRLEKS